MIKKCKIKCETKLGTIYLEKYKTNQKHKRVISKIIYFTTKSL
jgi:hypothetical protein